MVRLRWVPTSQPFLPLDSFSVVNNRIWNEDQVSVLTVGELPPFQNHYKQDARWRLPAGFVGGHMCHPEWFMTGEPWPNDLPPVEYDDFWIPTCCGQGGNTAQGGVELGGATGERITYTDATVGGFVVGGQVGSIPAGIDPTAGGLVAGGAAGDVIGFADGAAGGLVAGGAAGDVHTGDDSTQGGMVVGGSAGDLFGAVDLPAGGVEGGDSCGDILATTDAAAGGVMVGGAAGDGLHTTDAAAGGVVVGGSAGDGLHTTDAAAGGVVAGGSAGDVFTPPSSVTSVVTTGTNGAMVVSLPSGSAGMYVVLLLNNLSFTATPTGWTNRGIWADAGVTAVGTVYTRAATGAATVTFTSVFQTLWRAVALYVPGATAFDGISTFNSGTSTAPTCLTVTSGGTGRTLISCYSGPAATAPVITAAAGQTQVQSAGTMALTVGYETGVGAGATGPRVGTSTPSGGWGTIQIVIH